VKGDFANHLEGASAPAPPHPAGTVRPPVLILSDVSNDQGPDARAREEAEDILSRLDQIRLGLLEGGILRRTLSELGALVARHRREVQSPGLREVLDQVELRARVELAKHTRTA